MKKLNDNDFPLSRYRHCYSVGKKMYYYAKNVLKWREQLCNEMFVLGNLHDIGYELNPDAFEHDDALADTLCSTYKYANEIRYHSKLQHDYDSAALQLLYFADMTVDGMGNWCTFEERLTDLETRYGKGSEVYAESKAIADYLLSLGFDDKL